MYLVILLIAILAVIIYSVTKKNTTSSKNKIEAQQNQQCTQNINESTFNPSYNISKDNGLETVQSCGR
jgi:hypothetical protein